MPSKVKTAALRAKGLCTDCWKPSTKFRCDDCQAKARERYRRIYSERSALGLCVDCGKFPSALGTKKCQKHIEIDRKKDKRKRDRLKDQVFAAYGGYVCKCCKEPEPDFLTIDHINEDGHIHRRTLRGNNTCGGLPTYTDLRRRGFPAGYQVLCFNCNRSKHLNGGKCIHEIKRLQ